MDRAGKGGTDLSIAERKEKGRVAKEEGKEEGGASTTACSLNWHLSRNKKKNGREVYSIRGNQKMLVELKKPIRLAEDSSLNRKGKGENY